ncbi:MAG: dihydrolipoyl dehydrogenase [Deltaproteobacteria bacterium]|nr:dihydrolipoyl dehydrogenase [Deltaproteobacteria bacterium]
MDKKVDVAIIGAGTAGLSAVREVQKVTQNFVIINGGEYGTTCARVGCMPSKVLIQVANDFHRRQVFAKLGIHGGDNLTLNIPEALRHVRSLRDRFVGGVLKTVEGLGDHNMEGYAQFVKPNVLQVGGVTVQANKVILATGSRPSIPQSWQSFASRLITSDEIFEREDLPASIGVVGLGAIGLELGQALHRLGIKTTCVGRRPFIGGLSDPEVNRYAVREMSQEMDFWTGLEADVKPEGQRFRLSYGDQSVVVDGILASLGRRPNLENLGLEKVGIKLNAKGLPSFNTNTMQVEDLPIFIAGDINGDRSILHETADEGRIAGYNSVQTSPALFSRRAGLEITFCHPNIAVVGRSFADLQGEDIAIGEVKFDGQGRSLVMEENSGHLRVYGQRETGLLLGAEMVAPTGEHLAHLLSWVIQKQMTVFEVLQLPFYHPVVEEGLRTALRDLAAKVESAPPDIELALCGESGIECLS